MVLLHVSTVQMGRSQTPKLRRVKSPRGKSKRTASLGRSTWMIQVQTRLTTPVRLAFLVPTAPSSLPFRHSSPRKVTKPCLGIIISTELASYQTPAMGRALKVIQVNYVLSACQDMQLRPSNEISVLDAPVVSLQPYSSSEP